MNRTFSIILIILSLTTVVSIHSTAQGGYDYVRTDAIQPLKLSKSSLSFGFGIGGTYPYSGTVYSASPNLTLYYDYTVLNHAGPGRISIGTLLSFKQITSTYQDYSGTYIYKQNWNYYSVGSRIIYCLTESPLKDFEPYAGVSGSYYITGFKVSSNDPHLSDPADPGHYLTPNVYPNFFGVSIFAGLRTYITPRANGWIEIGYGYNTVSVGFSYRI